MYHGFTVIRGFEALYVDVPLTPAPSSFSSSSTTSPTSSTSVCQAAGCVRCLAVNPAGPNTNTHVTFPFSDLTPHPPSAARSALDQAGALVAARPM